jgi:hypothetical protein
VKAVVQLAALSCALFVVATLVATYVVPYLDAVQAAIAGVAR